MDKIISTDKRLIALSGDQRTGFAQQMVDNVFSGDTDALEAVQAIRSLGDILKQVESNTLFQDAVKTEIAKHGKSAILNGHTISTSEAGVTWDWSKCDDPVLKQLEAQFEEAARVLKERQEFLKKAPASGFTYLDTESGELLTVYPPARSSKTIIKVTLKK